MTQSIHYTNCPFCGSDRISECLTAIDYTVSKQEFSIWECTRCKGRFTQNIPGANDIGAYYQSDAYISHTNAEQGLINRLYHRVRRVTLQSKKKLIISQTSRDTGDLLDIGAGVGTFAHFMKASGWNVTGLEPDETTIQRARNIYGIELQHTSNLFSLPERSFDAITLWHVLEHVHDLNGYVERFKSLIKPGGLIFIAVPNYTSYDAGYYKEYWAAYDVPRHLYHFSPGSMEKLLIKHGFTVRSIRPMWFDSFYVSMLSQQYKTGKEGIFSGAWIGFVSNLRTIFNKRRGSSLLYVVELNKLKVKS